MADIAFFFLPWRGHLFTSFKLARSLKARGHRVRYLAGRSNAKAIKAHGGEEFLTNQQLYDDAEVYVSERYAGQLRSDLARYDILWRYGGVYVDCDLEALRPIDDLLDVPGFAGWETDGVWVNNAMASAINLSGSAIIDHQGVWLSSRRSTVSKRSSVSRISAVTAATLISRKCSSRSASGAFSHRSPSASRIRVASCGT